MSDETVQYEALSVNDLPWVRNIGTKIVDLVPMTATKAEKILGHPLKSSNADKEGSGYLVRYKDGYLSWSPKKAADEAYHPVADETADQAEISPKVVGTKTLHNSEVSGAKKNVKDTKIIGNEDAFQLLFKASSKNEGWMKSTKAMHCGNGQVVIQVTTQQRNLDGSYAVAEALTTVQTSDIVPDVNNGHKIVPSELVEQGE